MFLPRRSFSGENIGVIPEFYFDASYFSSHILDTLREASKSKETLQKLNKESEKNFTSLISLEQSPFDFVSEEIANVLEYMLNNLVS